MELNLLQRRDSSNLPKVFCPRRTFFCSPHSSRGARSLSYIWPLLGHQIIAGTVGFLVCSMESQTSSSWPPLDLRWIKAKARMEKLGSWRQLMCGAKFCLLVCSNFWVWLEVTLGNNRTRAELWERKGVRAESSRDLQVNFIQLFCSTDGKTEAQRVGVTTQPECGLLGSA